MRFVVTPHNIVYKPCKTVIATDDYSIEEIENSRHINDIKHDFDDERIKSVWKSKYAFVYPLTISGIDTTHYFKISLS